MAFIFNAAGHVVRTALNVLGSPDLIFLSGAAYGVLASPYRTKYADFHENPIYMCLYDGYLAAAYGGLNTIVGLLLGRLSPIMPFAIAFFAYGKLDWQRVDLANANYHNQQVKNLRAQGLVP